MQINLRTLFRLPVRTESNVYLGRIFDIEFYAESHMVRSYQVKKMFGRILRITPAQVRAITMDKIIVFDTTQKVEERPAPRRPARSISVRTAEKMGLVTRSLSSPAAARSRRG